MSAPKPPAPDLRIIYHDDGWQECAACGVKSSGSPGQVALGQMGMGHSPDCPNYPLLMQSVRSLFGRSLPSRGDS